MFNSNASIPLVSNVGNDSWGDGGFWWLIILLLFFGFGSGNGGWGYGNAGSFDNYTLASDFAQLSSRINQIGDGICDSTFALNNSINGGFATATNIMTQGFAGLNTVMVQNTNAIQNSVNDVSREIANCCCNTQRAIDGVNYNLATQSCATQRAIADAAVAIQANDNNNYRALHDEIVANRIEDKNARIAELEGQVQSLHLAASQQAQNNYLIGQLRPSPVPAYPVPSPYAANYGMGCGYGYGYGCGTTLA